MDLEKPHSLLQAEACDRRLPRNHKQRLNLEVKLRNLISGHTGEKTLNYFLSLMPNEKYQIYHGLRLPIGNSFFQIDGLLVSSKIIFVLESKNNAGILTIDKHQLTQQYDENTETYQNPVAQVTRHKILLKYFLDEYKIPTIPMEDLVVITRSSTELRISQGYTDGHKKVCKAEDLLKELQRLEKFNHKESFDKQTINKLKYLLLKKHTPLMASLLEELGIDRSEMLTGVLCPNCIGVKMDYYRKHWKCPKCLLVSKDAFIEAINGYFLLIKSTITNAELCAFLQLPSQRAATFIFSLLNLPSTGQNKGRVYHQPKLFPITVNHVFPNKTNTKKKQK
ncbi:MAG: nuclease-related domain-containing protein [Neobacillus sp.]